jgi:hypothetical protein
LKPQLKYKIGGAMDFQSFVLRIKGHEQDNISGLMNIFLLHISIKSTGNMAIRPKFSNGDTEEKFGKDK